MSMRGRVLRRQPVAVFERPRSIQEQREQYNYLAGLLRVPQYDVSSWPGWNTWLDYMNENKLFVRVKDVFSDWTGPEDAVAVRILLGPGFVLDLWWADIGLTNIPVNQKVGFLYLKGDGAFQDATVSWGEGGVVPEDTQCRVTVVTSSERPLYTLCLGGICQYSVGSWTFGQGLKECYFIHPFFSIQVLPNGEPSQVVYIQQTL